MHLTTYCCCIRSKAWTTCSLWATARARPYDPTGAECSLWATARARPYGPTGADSQQNILQNVERAGLLALYVE
jgi:hypothetical protein